ncbi:hypothetical protein K461DRAFT_317435 [Myriangium duriaei CBS 260.36]|uniref:Rhodopsin domain-containing protein n=1 Tax=Myriangium duriaei CBS 260.36 TaxID=1168546 RepID=A0A9P4JE38_9PEZI|nr:hypothetical protein K461DRAFT_317435 [Myriangium duriaei CBS 260.36]
MIRRQLDLFLCSIIIAVISTIVVGLRCATRFAIGGFGLDDWFMFVAQLLLIICASLAAVGATQGIGVRDVDLTSKEDTEARFLIFLFQVFYAIDLIFIKCSICFAIYRITTSKAVRAVLFFLVTVSTATGFAILGVLFSVCKPIAEIWLFAPGGYCVSTIAQNIKAVIVFGTISAIVTDFGCAVVPYVVLWNLQMPRKTKMILACMLGLSFIACAATIVRVQYIPRYTAAIDFEYGFTEPYIWTMVEIGIGTTIGSIPALKPILKKTGLLGTSLKSRPPTRGENHVLGSIHMQSHIVHSFSHVRAKGDSDEYELLNSGNEVHRSKSQITSRVTGGV